MLNLFLGTIFTIRTWIILKNNYEITRSWGKKDYKFCLTIIIVIIISITLSIVDFFIRYIYSVSLFIFVIHPILVFVNICFLLQIQLKMNKLDQSVNYNFNISELKKIRSYILVFISIWVINFYDIKYDNKILY
jgi:hypothetical protein